MIKGVKLTKAQVRVLRVLAVRPSGNTVWALGRPTCEALRKRGLVESSHGERRIHRFDGNPTVTITPAGRAALNPESKP